jgi:NAD(P)-dependent dehydrogenase (short-subunit alcohol dehydrogenase family)
MKTAVVTGAAGAIGSAVCVRLLARDYRVIAVDVDAARLDRLPTPVIRLRADLTAPDFCDDVTTAVQAAGGCCDLLVNTAGIVLTGPIEDADPGEIRREQLINLQAPMLLTRALLPQLKQVRGQVISVASLASMLPLAQSPGYSATKAGLRAFMLGLSQRERETGVRISLVHPGAVDTPMLRYEAANGGSPLNFLTAPIGPDDVADAVVANLEHPRLETFLPRHEGWLAKLLGLTPVVLQHIRPHLERAARTRLDTYRRDNALVPVR